MRPVSVSLLLICSYLILSVFSMEEVQNQRILRRVIKSTPTANNLTRVKSITITQYDGAAAQHHQPSLASFGRRDVPSSTAAVTPSTSTTSPTTTTTITTTTSAPKTAAALRQETSIKTKKPVSPITRILTTNNSDQQEASNQTSTTSPTSASSSKEVEILSVAGSMPVPAAEAPANIVAAESSQNGDLSSSSSSTIHRIHEESSSSDFLRSSKSSSSANYATKGGSANYATKGGSGKIFQQQQQNFFYPSQLRQQGTKTAQIYETKTSFYKPPTTTTTTTPRPAPLIQQQEYNDYQQQSEQYVEQQVDYGQAPLGQAEPFAFDFKMNDNQGNGQYRKEESDKNGVVRGSYGYTDANGIYRHVEYIADSNGFRANIKSNEPGLQGETMPASIQMAHSGNNNQQVASTQKLQSSTNNDNNNDNSWVSASAPVPTFEFNNRPERNRLPRTNLPQAARFVSAPIRPLTAGAEPEFGAHI